MRTTLDLFKEVKTRAIQQGVKLKELLATYIEAGLRRPERNKRSPASRKNPHPLPIAWAADGTVTTALSNAELDAILDQEDVENFNRVSSLAKPQP
jgi:hypothetical protein